MREPREMVSTTLCGALARFLMPYLALPPVSGHGLSGELNLRGL